jgi:hypothetical protein
MISSTSPDFFSRQKPYFPFASEENSRESPGPLRYSGPFDLGEQVLLMLILPALRVFTDLQQNLHCFSFETLCAFRSIRDMTTRAVTPLSMANLHQSSPNPSLNSYSTRLYTSVARRSGFFDAVRPFLAMEGPDAQT